LFVKRHKITDWRRGPGNRGRGKSRRAMSTSAISRSARPSPFQPNFVPRRALQTMENNEMPLHNAGLNKRMYSDTLTERTPERTFHGKPKKTSTDDINQISAKRIHEQYFIICPKCHVQNEYDSARGFSTLTCLSCKKKFLMESSQNQKFVYTVEYHVDRCGIELLPFGDPNQPGTRVGRVLSEHSKQVVIPGSVILSVNGDNCVHKTHEEVKGIIRESDRPLRIKMQIDDPALLTNGMVLHSVDMDYYRDSVNNFLAHMTLQEAYALQVGDLLDHRDKMGKWRAAEVVDVEGVKFLVRYEDISSGSPHKREDTWSDPTEELWRFAPYHSLSNRMSTRMPLVSVKHFLDVNPRSHPGWTKGTVRQMDTDESSQIKSGQVQVQYKAYCPILNKVREFCYWMHLDNPGEIAAASSKTLPQTAISGYQDKRIVSRLIHSKENNGRFPPDNLLDSNPKTFWAPIEDKNGPWVVELDLGALRPLSKIVLTNKAEDFVEDISVEDIQTQNYLVNQTSLSNSKKQIVGLTGRARYIRMVIYRMNSCSFPKLTRVEVYGMPQAAGPSLEGMLLTVHWHHPVMRCNRQLYTIPASASSLAHCFSIDQFINLKVEHAYRMVLLGYLDPGVVEAILPFLGSSIPCSYCVGDCSGQFQTFLE